MDKYQKSKIYKLYNDNIPNKVYYGSTTQLLSKRLYQHKISLKGQTKKLCSSSILFEKEGTKIILVENFKCNNKEELRKRERWYIENNECINAVIPYKSKEEHKERVKEWTKNNIDKVRINKKKYRDNNKEKEKKWIETNIEKVKEYKRQSYLKNKEEYIKNASIKLSCRICKKELTKSKFARHCKSKTHLNNL